MKWFKNVWNLKQNRKKQTINSLTNLVWFLLGALWPQCMSVVYFIWKRMVEKWSAVTAMSLRLFVSCGVKHIRTQLDILALKAFIILLIPPPVREAVETGKYRQWKPCGRFSVIRGTAPPLSAFSSRDSEVRPLHFYWLLRCVTLPPQAALVLVLEC